MLSLAVHPPNAYTKLPLDVQMIQISAKPLWSIVCGGLVLLLLHSALVPPTASREEILVVGLHLTLLSSLLDLQCASGLTCQDGT